MKYILYSFFAPEKQLCLLLDFILENDIYHFSGFGYDKLKNTHGFWDGRIKSQYTREEFSSYFCTYEDNRFYYELYEFSTIEQRDEQKALLMLET